MAVRKYYGTDMCGPLSSCSELAAHLAEGVRVVNCLKEVYMTVLSPCLKIYSCYRAPAISASSAIAAARDYDVLG